LSRQGQDALRHGLADHLGAVAVGELEENEVAAVALDEGPDGLNLLAEDQVALPMTRDGTVCENTPWSSPLLPLSDASHARCKLEADVKLNPPSLPAKPERSLPAKYVVQSEGVVVAFETMSITAADALGHAQATQRQGRPRRG
jgi:hypothetical protein